MAGKTPYWENIQFIMPTPKLLILVLQETLYLKGVAFFVVLELQQALQWWKGWPEA